MMREVGLVALCALLAACSSANVAPVVSGQYAHDAPLPATLPIQHVIVIVQENRTPDNLFNGFPGADTVTYGYGHGTKYNLTQVSMTYPLDINHSRVQFLEDYDNGMNDGFDRDIGSYAKSCANPNNEPACWVFEKTAPFPQYPYGIVPPSESKPYWIMAKRYAFGDRTFESNNGPSYPSHQYMIAGQSSHVVENPPGVPWGCDAPTTSKTEVLQYGTTEPPNFSPATGIEAVGPQPCFAYRTIADVLDRHNISWAYYAPAPGANGGVIWSAFDAIWPVRFGADWYADIKSPETRIFNDIRGGTLAQVSWVTPAYINSDHAGSESATGPDWVASIVNAIGTSRYWSSTAIVVLWDDWGGWYDHVVPPQYPNPLTGAYEGLGFRVPLIVISPYAKKHYVSHRQHEIASSLHFIEAVFRLPSIGAADVRADSLFDMFDFKQHPSAFRLIPTRMKAADFLRQSPSFAPPDD